MDSTIGFSTQNMSRYVLTRRSNCGLEPFFIGLQKHINRRRFVLFLRSYGPTDGLVWLGASNKLKCGLEPRSNGGRSPCIMELKRDSKTGGIRADLDCTATTSGDMENRKVQADSGRQIYPSMSWKSVGILGKGICALGF
jgi:hypothetical protein